MLQGGKMKQIPWEEGDLWEQRAGGIPVSPVALAETEQEGRGIVGKGIISQG